MGDYVRITDVALRDGLQIQPEIVATDDKVIIAKALVAAGIPEIEVGSFVRPDKVPQMADTDVLLPRIAAFTSIPLHTLAFNRRGAERAIAAGAKHVRLVVSASDGHSRSNAGRPTAEALDKLEETARVLTEHGIAVEGDIATAFVCPFEGDTPPARVLYVARRLVAMGATVISLADTIGAASPGQLRTLIPLVRREFTHVALGIHLHNTYGMAAACIMEALNQGIRRFDAALGAIGGCPFAPGATGNIGTDDLVHLLHREGMTTGIDVDRLVLAREKIAKAIKRPLESALSRIPATPAKALGRVVLDRENEAKRVA